ncbi:hypothetical protein [Clostridium tarantellae]|uniref:Uncharacterized protein n=1 Tax=Clostridium tarantellae TaxID=39493 RepID=A0A6I1MPY2_9CLOT|nr:hypothetical protein [Clostridium tarantellae]MPQ45124.1 hypothetical protein [Clostridium tarantellae]
MKKIKSILKHIPGYRTGNRVNEVIATIYYLFFLIFLTINITLGNLNFNLIHLCISGLAFPFIIFLIIDSLSKK